MKKIWNFFIEFEKAYNEKFVTAGIVNIMKDTVSIDFLT